MTVIKVYTAIEDPGQSSVIHMSLMLRSGLLRRFVIVVIFINDPEDQDQLSNLCSVEMEMEMEQRNHSISTARES